MDTMPSSKYKMKLMQLIEIAQVQKVGKNNGAA